MPLKFFRRFVPDAASVRERRLVRFFGAWLQHPNLWCLNRHSVPGAVAIGLLCGLIPGPLQMLCAVLLVIWLKKNLPVALVTTLYTNPLTIVPIYLVAYQYGSLFVPGEQRAGALPMYEMDWSDWWGSMLALWHWALALGKPLAIGLVALGLTLALAGWLGVRVAWELYVRKAWRRRGERRRGAPK